MTADNILYGIDFRAKHHERGDYDAELGQANQKSVVGIPATDTSPSEMQPYVAPERDPA